MCDAPNKKVFGWKGWMNFNAEPIALSPTSEWYDLSHCITENLSRSPAFPKPSIKRLLSLPQDIANVTEIKMVVHHGTHLDAPNHFIEDGPAFDNIPSDRLYGRCVTYGIDVGPLEYITADHLENAKPEVRPGDVLLINTGWWKKINSNDYRDHPSLDISAANWLVDNKIKLVGVDFSTPDIAAHLRKPNFTFPVHHVLLSEGILIAEHLTNLDNITNKVSEVIFGALNIYGSDGAPSRVYARTVKV